VRYIGNKENLVEKIFQVMIELGIDGDSFFDAFAGTTNVGMFFKKKGYQIFSSDLMYYSYVLQKAYIENNESPKLESLDQLTSGHSIGFFDTPLKRALNYLNQIPDEKGFVYKNYTIGGTSYLDTPRMYYTDENGMFIDKVRIEIEKWYKNGLIKESEYYVLLSCLIETVSFYANISGVYAAFNKTWDPRSLKKMQLRAIESVDNKKDNKVFNVDSKMLLSELKADIFYLDPPYNQRQYAPNYHLLETISRYDGPEIKGISGMRDYSKQKSKFCQKKDALDELHYYVKNGHYKHLILSYNNEGLMNNQSILEVLKQYGHVDFFEFDYTRYKSNKNSNNKFIKEHIYILSK
jgi:adenine-specific DNA-methyltransferase